MSFAYGRRRFAAPEQPRIRTNERIRVPEVRVINEDGEQIGILSRDEAISYARERGLDLVEVSPNARPPVCRVMDFGKYKYEQAKKQRAAKKKQHSAQVKEVKLRPKIDDHDFNTKVEAARKFLGQHHKVKLTIMFRGREMAHRERGQELLSRVIAALGAEVQIEHNPRFEGRNLTTVVSPRSAKGRTKKDASDEDAGGDKGSGARTTAEAPATDTQASDKDASERAARAERAG